MNRVVGGFLALALGLSLVAAEVRGQDRPATPSEQYKAILKESQDRYNASHKEFVASAPKGGMPSDEKRMEFVGRAYRIKYEQAPKLVDLAEKYPKDPIALDALIEAVWQVNTTPWPVELVGRDEARPRAFALLRRDHIRSDKLGPLCERISYGLCAEYEPFLREVLEKNPHKEVRAQACLALAHFLNNRSLRLDLVLEQPELAREFADLYGKEYLEGLRRQDRTKAAEEAEALLERAARDYGDVKLPDGETVAEKAEPELFGIRHLSVGKVAPDIEGEDQDGVRFKLSDYRGKVVLLDFWSRILTDLTGPVAPRAVARTDPERQALRPDRRQRRRQRQEAQGRGEEGEPDLAVVRGPGQRRAGGHRGPMEPDEHADALRPRSRGVIRYKWAGGPGEKAIDAALDKLIKEAEVGGKKSPRD